MLNFDRIRHADELTNLALPLKKLSAIDSQIDKKIENKITIFKIEMNESFFIFSTSSIDVSWLLSST